MAPKQSTCLCEKFIKASCVCILGSGSESGLLRASSPSASPGPRVLGQRQFKASRRSQSDGRRGHCDDCCLTYFWLWLGCDCFRHIDILDWHCVSAFGTGIRPLATSEMAGSIPFRLNSLIAHTKMCPGPARPGGPGLGRGRRAAASEPIAVTSKRRASAPPVTRMRSESAAHGL